uniref:Thioredoxin domain-containing protein n=1 Tax=Meloidogyne hapla TaxID=6305 RepID=A0A1I8BQG4_MELHA
MNSLSSTKTTKTTSERFTEKSDFKYLFSQSNDVQPFLRASLFDNVPPTILFYVKGTKVKKPQHFTQQLTWCNNSLLALVVRHSLLTSHFKLVEEDQFWFGYWGRHLKSAQYQTLKPCQKVNHFPGAFHLGRKDRLWLHLFDMMQRFPDDEFCIMPYTYILPKDIKRLRVYLSMKSVRHVILKPPASARGTGINIVSRFNMVPEKTSLVAQHYIESPFLINDSKFDLRVYVYVTSYDPLRIYVYKEGLVRFASVTYNPEMASYTNQFMHLTNYSINKMATTSTEDGEQFSVPKWRLTQFWKYLDKLGHNSSILKEEIYKIAIKAIISCESHIKAHAAHHCKYPFISYELYGMDILVDSNLRPWLIEMNISPSLHSSTPLDIAVKAPLAKDTLILAGIPFPISSDEDFFSSLYFLTRNLKAHKDEEHLEKEMAHLEYFNENKIFPLHSEQQVVFDVGTNGDAEKLKPIINRGDPIIFVFYAKWSGPSRSFTPRLEAKVKGQGGKILLAKIEVREEGNELSKHFGLTTVPTIDLFKNNEYLGRYEGVIEEDFLLDNLLEDLMAGRYESVRE